VRRSDRALASGAHLGDPGSVPILRPVSSHELEADEADCHTHADGESQYESPAETALAYRSDRAAQDGGRGDVGGGMGDRME
jgi:hypothetical protein